MTIAVGWDVKQKYKQMIWVHIVCPYTYLSTTIFAKICRLHFRIFATDSETFKTFKSTIGCMFMIDFHTSDRRQSKTLILSTNVDQKSLETGFLVAICRPTGYKRQSKHFS